MDLAAGYVFAFLMNSTKLIQHGLTHLPLSQIEELGEALLGKIRADPRPKTKGTRISADAGVPIAPP
jgi:hypothetical protein